MRQIDEKNLKIDKYKLTKLGDKEMHKLWEVYLSQTNRWGKIGTRSWQGLVRVSSSTRAFVITGYLNEWHEKFRLPFVLDYRYLAVIPMTRDLGWFWIKDGQLDFPPKSKSQKIEAPDGFMRRLTSNKDFFVEVKGDKLYIDCPVAKGLFGQDHQGQALADFCINLMLGFAELFVIGK